MARAALLVCLTTVGCATIAPEARENAVRGPDADRCAAQPDQLVHAGCVRARDKAQEALGALNRGDNLCLEPILNPDLDNCRARASVDEQDVRGIKLRFIDVQPGSSWAPYANAVRWFDNTALIDLYLKERGF